MSTLECEARLKDVFLLSNLKTRLTLTMRTESSILAIAGWENSLVRLAVRSNDITSLLILT